MNAMKYLSRLAAIRRHPFAVLTGLFIATLAVGLWQFGWADLWATPDQRGRRLFEHPKYERAAEAFLDPMWRGAALMRAGNFKEAAQVFGNVDTAEAAYDQGNALVMLGKYEDAVGRYDRALALRHNWPDAEANRTLARLRAERMKAPGADAGDQREGADEIVYDKDKRKDGGQETETAGSPMNDEQIRSLWLKQVQTRPADFLRARFAYQLQVADKERAR
jgi:Ca-activated chloride channel family protein